MTLRRPKRSERRLVETMDRHGLSLIVVPATDSVPEVYHFEDGRKLTVHRRTVFGAAECGLLDISNPSGDASLAVRRAG